MPPTEGSTALRRNAIANVIGRRASVLMWVVLTPFLLARLGDQRFGVWSLIFGFSGYVANLDFGMTSSVARFVAVAIARRDRRSAG